MSKLWGGRFEGGTDPAMHAFNASINVDRRLWAADIKGSQAYAKALTRTGLITETECTSLVEGLDQISQEWSQGTFKIDPVVDEDIHTANERRLGELIGTHIAGKLHTGRSRNDQVATDLRIWVRDQGIALIVIQLKQLINVFTDRAESDVNVILPGYTHLQRAQPIRWSHFLLSHAFAFAQDLDRFLTLSHRVNSLPLGAGALAGNPFNIDRAGLAKDLGFAKVLPNSLHAVSDRDFVAEYLFTASLVMTHISRLAEDLITYASAEFGFITIADAYSTGSSLMPQKKNPDALELLRGKCGRVTGNLMGFLMTYKGLPSTYNKDLQEDKEPLFDAYDTLLISLPILARVVDSLTVHPIIMKQACTWDMLATDLADYLVRKGVPFRETHHIAGAAVKLAETRQCSLVDFTVEDWKKLNPLFDTDVSTIVFDVEASVDRRVSAGGTARQRVLEQITLLRSTIGESTTLSS